MVNVLVNAIVLTIIIWLVLRGEDRPNTSGLLALPLGLSILALVFSLLLGGVEFIGRLYLIAVFAVSVFSLRWSFDITLWQSLLVSGIWIAWLVLYPFLGDLL